MTDTPTFPQSPPSGTIVVPGVGRILVEPDLATIRLGVATIRPTATAARAAAAETMAAVIAAIRGGGVARPDLRTVLVGLDAVRDYTSGGEPRITGYQLTNTVEATIRDTTTVGAIVDGALAAGATSLDGLEFRLAEPEPAETAARQAAIADALRRATTIAEAAGVGLGPVIAAVEGGRLGGPIPLPAAEMRMKAAAADTPVEGGSQDVVVSLVVTFRIG